MTEPRLDQALARAAEWGSFTNQNAHDWLINWAKAAGALEAVADRHIWHPDGECICKPHQDAATAVAKFCAAMLGGRND